MQVVVNTRELDNLEDRILAAMEHMYRNIALQLWGDIRQETPVRTGRAAGSWELNQLGRLTWRIHTAVSYVVDLMEGTDPHEIRPVNAKALAFKIDGQTIFAKRVMHPGTPPNPFIDRAIARTEGRIDDFVDQALDAVGG